MITNRIFAFLGIGLIILGLLLGYIFQNSGCGICGGEYRLIPTLTTTMQYIPSFSKPSQSACAMMGCSAGVIYPVFLDIYLSGFLFIFLGIFNKIRLKQKSRKK